MSAPFDGTAETLETPFDGVTSVENAMTTVVASIPPQRTQWDTSNIVSGTSLTPANVGGGFPQTFRSDQIPWSDGAGPMWPNLLPLLNSGTTRIEASNVYGELVNANIDVGNLVGGVIATSHLPTAPTYSAVTVTGTLTSSNVSAQFLHGALSYASLTGAPTSLTAFANDGSDRYAHMTDLTSAIAPGSIPWVDVLVSSNVEIQALNINQPFYSYSNFVNVNWYQHGLLNGLPPSSSPLYYPTGSITINTTSSVGNPNLSQNYVTSYVKLLTDTGVLAQNLAGQILLSALPNFLQPTITYDVTNYFKDATPLNQRTLTSTSDISAYFHAEFPSTTDAVILSTLGLDPYLGFDQITSINVFNETVTSTATSNMRFSLGNKAHPLSNVATDYLTTAFDANVNGNLDVIGSATVKGNLTVNGTISGTLSGSTSSSSTSSSDSAAMALGALGTLFGLGGAFTSIFGGKATGAGNGAAGPQGEQGPQGAQGPPGPPGQIINTNTGAPQKTLQELLNSEYAYFASNVNVLITDYNGNPANVKNLLGVIVGALKVAGDPASINYRMNRNERVNWYNCAEISSSMIDILERTAKAGGFQLVNQNVPPASSTAGLEGPASLLPNVDTTASVEDVDPLFPSDGN